MVNLCNHRCNGGLLDTHTDWNRMKPSGLRLALSSYIKQILARVGASSAHIHRSANPVVYGNQNYSRSPHLINCHSFLKFLYQSFFFFPVNFFNFQLFNFSNLSNGSSKEYVRSYFPMELLMAPSFSTIVPLIPLSYWI